LQRAELFDHEKPEDDDRAAGIQEILPPLPQAYAAQGSEVIERLSDRVILRLKTRQPEIFSRSMAQSRNDSMPSGA
jgi:hypothetical protein